MGKNGEEVSMLDAVTEFVQEGEQKFVFYGKTPEKGKPPVPKALKKAAGVKEKMGSWVKMSKSAAVAKSKNSNSLVRKIAKTTAADKATKKAKKSAVKKIKKVKKLEKKKE